MDHSVEGPTEGTETSQYPDNKAKTSSTGVNALLFGLRMIEYLRTIDDSRSDKEFTSKVRTSLEGIVRYLKKMHLPNTPIISLLEQSRKVRQRIMMVRP
jgi:hypothetical protein